MTSSTRSVVREFVLAGISIVVAVSAGVAWLGQPLRLVQLVTIVGLSMTAGVSWAQALWRARQQRSGGTRPLETQRPADGAHAVVDGAGDR